MKTIYQEMLEAGAIRWILWWIGTLIFMAGLVALICFDQDYLEYPLLFLMFPLLIFYFRQHDRRSDISP